MAARTGYSGERLARDLCDAGRIFHAQIDDLRKTAHAPRRHFVGAFLRRKAEIAVRRVHKLSAGRLGHKAEQLHRRRRKGRAEFFIFQNERLVRDMIDARRTERRPFDVLRLPIARDDRRIAHRRQLRLHDELRSVVAPVIGTLAEHLNGDALTPPRSRRTFWRRPRSSPISADG